MITLIAALAENNCIGKNGTLPWHIPEDLAHFKELTNGKIVLMGRKTWESLPEKFRPLPNRKNIVISRQKGYELPADVEIFDEITDAFKKYQKDEIFVIGGAEIYRQSIEAADILEITRVHQVVDGDAFFPEIKKDIWEEVGRIDFEKFSFLRYKKI
jgi:dihydrofolate reductase